MKQIPLPQFIQEYGIPRTNVERLIHSHGFPAYKLGGRWYVDILQYEKWREAEHQRQYKYATPPKRLRSV